MRRVFGNAHRQTPGNRDGGRVMDLLFYVLFGVILLAAIYWIVRGKRT